MSYSPARKPTIASETLPQQLSDESRPLKRPTRFTIDTDFWVEEVTHPEMIAATAEDWDDLAANAARPNVFFERWMLEAAWRAFKLAESDSNNVTVAIVYRRGRATQFPPVPIGLFPCVVEKDLGPCIGPVLSFWDHAYCFDTTPLLRTGFTSTALDVFLRWAAARRSECKVVRFNDVAADGPLQTSLIEWMQTNRAVAFDLGARNRAALFRAENYDDYIERAISSSTRRELRRQGRRLADVGELETVVTTDVDSIDDWANRFLALEETGWKKDTAMNREQTDSQFFRNMLRTAAERQQFEGLDLQLDGRSIAMKCNVHSSRSNGRTPRIDVAFKIAYDETFKKFSPGVLLELENIKRFHKSNDSVWMDSCAKSGHPMIDRLWGDRTPRTNLLVANGGIWPRAIVGAMHLVRCVRRVRSRIQPSTSSANF